MGRVTACAKRILAFFQPVLDVGPIAQSLQPFLESRVSLACMDGPACGLALPLVTYVLGSTLDYLDQVPAERGLHRFTDLSGLKRVQGVLEFWHGVAR